MSKLIDKAEKSEVIENILEGVSQLIGTPRSVAFKEGICVLCGGEAKEFRDTISEKEFSLSGMCQNCQDEMFE